MWRTWSFTSGSTGRPKGVIVEHKSLLNLIYWHQSAFAMSSADTVAQVAGPAFDAALWELWPSLATGARLVIAPSEVRINPELLRNWLIDNGITVTFSPTPRRRASYRAGLAG